MDDLLNQLETHIKSFVQRYEHLRHSNSHLKQNQSIIAREKELLLAKNKIAITQIEAMVSRLKSIEKLT